MGRSLIQLKAEDLLTRLDLNKIEIEVTNSFDPQDHEFVEVPVQAEQVLIFAELNGWPHRKGIRAIGLVPTVRENFVNYVGGDW